MNLNQETMSKNLSKASDWAQREIDDLQDEAHQLSEQAEAIKNRIQEVNEKISMLVDIKEKLNGEEKPLI